MHVQARQQGGVLSHMTLPRVKHSKVGRLARLAVIQIQRHMH